MINKKNVLGKTPEALGAKDAVHVAIVAVRASKPIQPGTRCGLNNDREAEPQANGPGIADPFLKKTIQTGQVFWLVLCQNEVPNVVHLWEHPTLDFSPPDKPVRRNATIECFAKDFGVTYEQLMDAAEKVVATGCAVDYPGTLSLEQVDGVNADLYDFWYEWAEEAGHEFENTGSVCCPEYDYPNQIFKEP